MLRFLPIESLCRHQSRPNHLTHKIDDMNLKTTIVRRHLPVCALVLLLGGIVTSNVSAQGFNFDLGQATVDISSGAGIVPASFTIAIENPTDAPLDLAAYSLFLDIGPAGLEMPAGVTFDTTNGANDAVTYIAGNGTAPLTNAGQEPPGATINFTPAAGDLGLGQIQFTNGSLAPGASADLLTVNLTIDLSTAVAGEFAIVLSSDGQNVVVTASNDSQPFEFTAGTLSLVDSPFMLGDVNCDGAVNFLDINPFIALLAVGGFLDKADINRDGEVTFLDIGPFIALLSSSGS